VLAKPSAAPPGWHGERVSDQPPVFQRPDRIPGEHLDPLPGNDGNPTIYAASDMRTVTGTRIARRPERVWYRQRGRLLASDQAPVVTAAHPQMELWMKVLEGFDERLPIKQPPVSQWPMSRVIPRVNPSPKGLPFQLPVGTYWLDYNQISKSLRHLPEREWTYDAVSQYPADARLMLGFIGEHLISRLLWRHRYSLWRHPFFEQFRDRHAIVCPDFSSWLTDPRPQALVGQRMTQQFAELGSQHGYTMIPIVTWQSRDMLLRQIDMLGSLYPKVNTVYIYLISMGVNRDAWMWSRFDDIVETGLNKLPFRFVISGSEAGKYVHILRDEVLPAENFHLVSANPYMKATKGFASNEERALIFRQQVQRIEEYHRGEHLPPKAKRAEDPWAAIMGEDALPLGAHGDESEE